ncbi:unnamed protein product [Closterium sp. NIES-53]
MMTKRTQHLSKLFLPKKPKGNTHKLPHQENVSKHPVKTPHQDSPFRTPFHPPHSHLCIHHVQGLHPERPALHLDVVPLPVHKIHIHPPHGRRRTKQDDMGLRPL